MEYFIIENGQQAGPFTLEQLAEKHITSETLVWTEGMSDWTPAWKVQALRDMLNGTTEQDNAANSTTTVPPIPQTDAYQQGFQQGFQQAQQAAWQNQQNAPKKSSGFLWKALLICLLLIVGILAFTNPGKEAHKEAVKAEVNQIIEKSAESTGNDLLSQGMKMFTQIIAGNFIDTVIDQLFEYHNYVIFSKSTVTFDGKTHTISYGCLGKVFTFNADDVTKALEENGSNIKIPSVNEDNSLQDEEEIDNQQTGKSDSLDEDNLSSSIQKKLEDKANQALDKLKDKTKQKVKKKIDEVLK